MELNGLYTGISCNGQPICRGTSCTNEEAEKKGYWYWKCHRCGFDDNRNNNPRGLITKIVDGQEIKFTKSCCSSCGEMIRCETSGGHTFYEGENYCTGGCGRMRDGSYDPRYRRDNY